MDIASQNHYTRILQECLIKIYQKMLRITRTEINMKFQSNDYIETLLDCLKKELKKYGMYSKFENMSNDYRRKELIVLLTKQLGVKLNKNEAGDIFPFDLYFRNRNIYDNSGDNDCIEKSFRKTPYIENSSMKLAKKISTERNLNHYCIQYDIYARILNQIQNELNGICRMMTDPVTNVLLIGLCVRLQQKRIFSQLTLLPVRQRRRQLLKLLAARLIGKCKQIVHVDRKQITKKQTNGIPYRQTCSTCPNKIWEKIINFGPAQELMSPLYTIYPIFILEIFLEYLSEAKENIIFEQERIFRTKLFLLRREGLETVESIKKNLRNKKYIEVFLHEYISQLHNNYEKTEKEFYRQEKLKREIYGTVIEIKRNINVSNSNLRQINMEIAEKQNSLHVLYNNLNELQEMF